MRSTTLQSLLLSGFVLFLVSCSSVKKITQPAAGITAIKFLGEYDIPDNLIFQNTTVGGLSGIDYDAKNDQYYMICDDRSDKNPARFYTARIFFTGKGIDSVQFTGVKSLLTAAGNVYPGSKQDPYHTPDPEAMRYDAVHKRLVWTSEGERIIRAIDTVLADPSVTIISTAGKYIDSFPLPVNLRMHATEKGPRQNGVLEGLTFANNYQTVFVSVEEPLYEDGPRADVLDNNAMIRIYKFDAATKQNLAQYAYRLDPIANPANPPAGFKINGVPDILSIGNNKLLVLERSFSTGIAACTIKVFIADLRTATDVSTAVLKDNNNFTPVSKKLLLNMNELGIYTDNIEGMTFGPLLPNGHKTILFLADNNFSSAEKAQVFLFEVIE
jgi:hypothetical protein